MFPCPSKTFFGIECLGCGAQRALWSLLQGNFKEAFYLYPAIYTLIPLAFVFLLNKVHKTQSYAVSLKVLLIVNLVLIVSSYAYKHWV